MMLFVTILQVALGIFSKNPELSAGNLCGYFPQDTLVSEAPKGYKPFYISHIARHGSRFLDKEAAKYFQVIDTLDFYAAKGMLTPDGLELRNDLRVMYEMSEGHYGELTELGAREHRQICSRMVRHYPEVFADGNRTYAQAFSTGSPRVIASMNAFLGELSARKSALVVDTYISNWGTDTSSQEVIGYYKLTTEEQKKVADKKTRELRKLAKTLGGGSKGDYHVFARRIFLDPDAVASSTVYYLAKYSYKALRTGRVTDPAAMPSMGKYHTPEELYTLWISNGINWLKNVDMPGYESPLADMRGGGILDRIVKDADQAIRDGSNVAATLRFSHDSYLLPLMAAIPLEGALLECEEEQLLEQFQDFNFIPPACNVQLIFYRRKGRGPVLVKFLRNEKETLIHGLAPKTGCYYDWNAVKQFWGK